MLGTEYRRGAASGRVDGCAGGREETAMPKTRKVETAFGVDIGGSGIKGAIVDLAGGQLLTPRKKYLTPRPSAPDAVAEVVARLVTEANWTGLVGATFPAVMKNGVALTAANVDKSWIGTDVDAVFTKATDCDVTVLNDADAAGLAEARYGAAAGVPGVVILLTFGTGIGSALLLDGDLVPNTELGHLEVDGKDAEKRAAASVKDIEGLSYRQWAKRVQRYLSHVEALFTPDLFVLGGGVSKAADKWIPLIELRTPMKPAELLNNAGIVGAALAAAERHGE
jgi:polyphosphate glucokinase